MEHQYGLLSSAYCMFFTTFIIFFLQNLQFQMKILHNGGTGCILIAHFIHTGGDCNEQVFEIRPL